MMLLDLGFKFQSYFLGFNFQTAWDSGFKFQMGGIQDSNYVFQGPINVSAVETLSALRFC